MTGGELSFRKLICRMSNLSNEKDKNAVGRMDRHRKHKEKCIHIETNKQMMRDYTLNKGFRKPSRSRCTNRCSYCIEMKIYCIKDRDNREKLRS